LKSAAFAKKSTTLASPLSDLRHRCIHLDIAFVMHRDGVRGTVVAEGFNRSAQRGAASTPPFPQAFGEPPDGVTFQIYRQSRNSDLSKAGYFGGID
jgi:hypothetical protein